MAIESAHPRSGLPGILSRASVATTKPWAGAVLGLTLVALLVPVLIVAGGVHGDLHASVPLLFLIPVLIASFLGGGIAGIVVSVAAVFVWDWFFIQPLHKIVVDSPTDVLALTIFFAIALLTGQLSTLVRRRGTEAIQRAGTTEALYDVSTALIGSHDVAVVLPLLAQRLRETFDLQGCVVLLKSSGGTWETATVAGEIPPDLDFQKSRSIAGILAWVDRTGQMSGLGESLASSTSTTADQSANLRRAQFWPLTAGNRTVGVLQLVFRSGAQIDRERDRLLATLVNGAAIVIEHERLFREEQSAAIAHESDRLKSALLSSVSHDLRTPLAGIKAAATSLLQDDVEWNETDRRAFILDINAESDRLARFVSNLLDLSRIEAGALKPNREREDARELVERVVQRLNTRGLGHVLGANGTSIGLDIFVDPVHIEQVLTNLIENAMKYSPAGTTIRVDAARNTALPDTVTISIADQGPGIALEEQSRIFDTFYRIAERGRSTAGTGMGLAIVKGLVEANGGTITIESTPGLGATFSVIFPAARSLLAVAGHVPDSHET